MNLGDWCKRYRWWPRTQWVESFGMCECGRKVQIVAYGQNDSRGDTGVLVNRHRVPLRGES